MQKSMSLDKDQEKIILEALKILHEWVAIKDINKAQKKLAEIKTLPTLLATPHYCSLLTIAHELVAACLNQLKAPEHIETAEKLYYEVTQTIPQLIFTKLDFAIQIDFYYTAGCTFASAQQLKTALPYFCAALNLLEQLPENKPYILKTTQEAIHAKLTQLEIEGWLQILCRYWQKCPPFSTASKNALATLKQQFKALRTLGDGLAYLAQENNSDYYAQCLQHLYHPFLPLIEQAKQELNSKLNFAKQQKQEALLQFSELVNEQLLPLAQQLSFHGQWKLAEEFCGLVIAHYNQDGEDIEAFNTQVIVALSNCAHKKIIQPFFPYRAFWQQQRAQLKIYRDKWQDTVDKIDLSEWQIYYQEQVSALTSTALKRLSEPLVMPKPTAWCLVGGGSFGRQESLFYSDIDVALLIKTDVKENATYFDTILALLTFQIELWAEPWQWKSRELPLTKVSLGLRLDSGDLKYLCQSLEDSLNYQKYHLVLRQTPDKLAQFVVQNLDLKAIRAAKQNEQYHVLAHGLLGITPIFSFQEGAALVDNYYACIEQQLQLTISPFDNKFAPIHLYQWVGWQLFQEAVQDLYKMGRSWDKWPVTDLKQRYLAPLQRVCLAMGLFFNLKEKNSTRLLTNTLNIMLALQAYLDPIWLRQLSSALLQLQKMRAHYQWLRRAQPDEVYLPQNDSSTHTSNRGFNPAVLHYPWQVNLKKKDFEWLKYEFLLATEPLFNELKDLKHFTNLPALQTCLFNPVKTQFAKVCGEIPSSEGGFIMCESSSTIIQSYINYLILSQASLERFCVDYRRLCLMSWRHDFIQYLTTAFKIPSQIYSLAQQKAILTALSYIPLANGDRLGREGEQQSWRQLLQEITEVYDEQKKATYETDKRMQVTWHDGKQRFERLLKIDYAQQLLQADGNFEESKRVNLHSRRTVIALYPKESNHADDLPVIFCKAYPELPGVQMSVDLLTQRIAGYSNIATLAVFTPLANPNHAYPVLFSKPAGNTLQYLAENNKLKNAEENIDPYCFTLKFFTEVLLHLEDDKKDNVTAETFLNGDGKTVSRYVSIDSDHAYVSALVNEQDEEKVNVKSVVLVSNMMAMPLDQRAVDDFLSLNGYEVLNQWLTDLSEWNQRYIKAKDAVCKQEDLQRWSAEKAKFLNWLWNFDKTFSFVPVVFAPGLLVMLYERWQRLQQILLEKQENHFTVLRLMEPRLAYYYEQSFKKFDNLADRFDDLPTNHQVTKQIKSATLSRRKPAEPTSATIQHMSLFNTRSRLQESLQAPNKPQSKNLPEAIATGYYYDPKQAQKDLQQIHEYFTNIKQLQQLYLQGDIEPIKFFSDKTDPFWQFVRTNGLHHIREKVMNSLQTIPEFFGQPLENDEQTAAIKARQTKLLNSMIGTRFRCLILKNWQALTDDLLIKILKHCPDLRELDVSNCIQLTSKIVPMIAESCPVIEKIYLNKLPLLNIIKSNNPKKPLMFKKLRYLEIKNNQLEVIELQKPKMNKENKSKDFIYNSNLKSWLTDFLSEEKLEKLNVDQKNPKAYDHSFKILLAGDSGIGKRSLIDTFDKDKFKYIRSNRYNHFSYFISKEIKFNQINIILQIRSYPDNPLYDGPIGIFRNVNVFIVIFDLINRKSFLHVENWIEEIELMMGQLNFPIILVGTKADLIDSRQITDDEILEMSKKIGAPYIECSAKMGKNVDLIFETAAKLALYIEFCYQNGENIDLALKEIAKLALNFSISRDSDSNDKSTSQNVSTYAQILQIDSRMKESTKPLVIQEQSSKPDSNISLPFNDSQQEQQINPQNTKKLAESITPEQKNASTEDNEANTNSLSNYPFKL